MKETKTHYGGQPIKKCQQDIPQKAVLHPESTRAAQDLNKRPALVVGAVGGAGDFAEAGVIEFFAGIRTSSRQQGLDVVFSISRGTLPPKRAKVVTLLIK